MSRYNPHHCPLCRARHAAAEREAAAEAARLAAKAARKAEKASPRSRNPGESETPERGDGGDHA